MAINRTNTLVSLNAVAVAGPGDVLELSEAKAFASMQVIVSGSPSSLSVFLEGSLDGANWLVLSSGSANNASQNFLYEVGGPSEVDIHSKFCEVTHPSGIMFVSSWTTPVLYVRARNNVDLTGTGAAVTAIVAAA